MTYSEGDLLDELRHRYLMEVRAALWTAYEEGLAQPQTVTFLDNSIKYALDLTDAPLNDFEYVKMARETALVRKTMFYLYKYPCFRRMIEACLFTRLASTYDIFVNYIESHKSALNLLI